MAAVDQTTPSARTGRRATSLLLLPGGMGGTGISRRTQSPV
jgi:hypothetical protein